MVGEGSRNGRLRIGELVGEDLLTRYRNYTMHVVEMRKSFLVNNK